MKRMSVLILLIAIGHTLLAQRMTIAERKIDVRGKPVNAWVVPVGDNHELAKKTFISFVKKELRLKPESKGKMIVISQEVNLPAVTINRGDLTAILFSEYDDYKMGVAFVLGYDIALNSKQYPGEMSELRDITIDYLRYYYTHLYDDALEAQKKEKLRLEKQVERVEKEISSLQAAYQRDKRRVYKTEDAVARLELRSEALSNEQICESLRTQLLELHQEIVRTHFNMNKIREEYHEVMAQIRALRTTLSSQVSYGDHH